MTLDDVTYETKFSDFIDYNEVIEMLSKVNGKNGLVNKMGSLADSYTEGMQSGALKDETDYGGYSLNSLAKEEEKLLSDEETNIGDACSYIIAASCTEQLEYLSKLRDCVDDHLTELNRFLEDWQQISKNGNKDEKGLVGSKGAEYTDTQVSESISSYNTEITKYNERLTEIDNKKKEVISTATKYGGLKSRKSTESVTHPSGIVAPGQPSDSPLYAGSGGYTGKSSGQSETATNWNGRFKNPDGNKYKL